MTLTYSGRLRMALAVALTWGCCALHAQQRLDDSASPRSQVAAVRVVSETGQPIEHSLQARRAIAHFGLVEYRLATAAYLGRQARIHFVVPALVPGLSRPSALLVRWRAQGDWASGSAHAGERLLVWNGTVREAFMNTRFDLVMELDLAGVHVGAGSEPQLGLSSYFDIEVMP